MRFISVTAQSCVIDTYTRKVAARLSLCQTSPVFTCLQFKSFENSVGKGEIAHNEQFLLFSQCFLLI